MKKSDIYEIAIKIMGLYLFFLSFDPLRDVLLTFVAMTQAEAFPDLFGNFDRLFFFVSLGIFLIVILFAALLTFKTKAIVKLVCKQADHEETASLFADRSVIYEMALVIMGLILIAWTIPDFVFRLKNYLQADPGVLPRQPNENSFIIIAVIKVVVGIVSIIYSKSIATFLAKENKTRQPE